MQRLGTDGLAVHLRNSLSRLLGGAEVHEAESLGNAIVVLLNDGRGDLTAGGEHLAQFFLVSDVVVKVPHEHVSALERSRVGNLRPDASNIQVPNRNLLAGDSKDVCVVEFLDTLECRIGSRKVDIMILCAISGLVLVMRAEIIKNTLRVTRYA
jgi:hypothetical protein